MFKSGSVENEIYRSMEKTLVKNQTESQHGFDKLSKAVDFLNKAAGIFDQSDMFEVSQDITDILQNLTQDIK